MLIETNYGLQTIGSQRFVLTSNVAVRFFFFKAREKLFNVPYVSLSGFLEHVRVRVEYD